MKLVAICVSLLLNFSAIAQEKPYYYQIPAVPETFTAASVAARMVDGLGFRYFWATYELNEKDLAYKPSEESRTSFETLEHIDGLTKVLLNAVNKKINTAGGAKEKLSFAELRQKTLEQIKMASDVLKQPGTDLEELKMIFERKNGNKEYPFWNLVNGPIADALWHVGQVVTFRRSSGNPLPKGVSVLEGIKSE